MANRSAPVSMRGAATNALLSVALLCVKNCSIILKTRLLLGFLLKKVSNKGENGPKKAAKLSNKGKYGLKNRPNYRITIAKAWLS
jgi:hypothetical protein